MQYAKHLKWNINAWDTAIALQKQLSCRIGSPQPCHHVVPTNQTSFKPLCRHLANRLCNLAIPLLPRWMLLPCCTAAILSAIWNCNRICVKLLQLMCAVSTQNSAKNEVSVLINGWVTANYSVSRPPFCPPSWNLISDLCQTSTSHVRCHYAQFSVKKRSLYINKWLIQKYQENDFILYHGVWI